MTSTLLRAWRVAVAVVLLGLFAGVLSFVSALAVVLWSFGGSGDMEVHADCAVVFGAAVYGADRPGPAVVRRVETAASLYIDGKVQRLYFTGGKGGPQDVSSEAEVMSREAMRLGVPASAIVLEEQAHSTLENIRLTRPLTKGCTSVVAISDQFHMARIRLLARREGWNSLRLVPAQGRPPSAFETRSVLREVLGYMYYVLHFDALIETDQLRQWKASGSF